MARVKDSLFEMESTLDHAIDDIARISDEIHQVLYQMEYDYPVYRDYLEELLTIEKEAIKLCKEIEIDLDGRSDKED